MSLVVLVCLAGEEFGVLVLWVWLTLCFSRRFLLPALLASFMVAAFVFWCAFFWCFGVPLFVRVVCLLAGRYFVLWIFLFVVSSASLRCSLGWLLVCHFLAVVVLVFLFNPFIVDSYSVVFGSSPLMSQSAFIYQKKKEESLW